MRYLSVCSGIEAATAAWEPLGWAPVAFAEVEKFPCAVLAHHYPDVPNLGDMTKINGADWRGQVDVLVGGTPCQAFSVAGLRNGLHDERGGLTVTFAELVRDIEPAFTVWENVPGVLSDKTNAFGCLLGALAGEDDPLVPPGGKWSNAGYVLGPERAIAWRTLDAQYFGVAQRRRRVFLVACPRNGADPRAVLFEREGVRRDSAPSREAGKGFAHNVAPSLGASGRGVERTGETRGQDPVIACLNGLSEYNSDIPTLRAKGADVGGGSEALLAFGGNNTSRPIDTATTTAHPSSRLDFESETFVTHSLRAEGFDASEDGTGRGRGTPLVPVTFDTTQTTSKENRSNPKPGDPVHPLASGAHAPAIAFSGRDYGNDALYDLALTMRSCNDAKYDRSSGWSLAAAIAVQVRRLTPRECERLQGFPDDYTAIPWRGKPADQCPDGPRYKALGNSMAVPCMAWIGKRIEEQRK